MVIKNIVFDIGNVLADFKWEEYYNRFGYEKEILDKLAHATVKSKYWSEFDKGIMTEEEILQAFIRIEPTIEKEIRTVLKNMGDMVVKNDYAIPWIQSLKAKGYQIYIISNFSEKGFDECKKALDFMEYVDGSIISYREKLIKPDHKIYHTLLERYQLKAEECVFLDDMPQNIAAAKEVGMQGIIFQNQNQAIEELEKLGVKQDTLHK